MSSHSSNQPELGPKNSSIGWWIIAAVLLVLAVSRSMPSSHLLPYSDFLAQVESDRVVSVELQGNQISGRLSHAMELTSGDLIADTFVTRMPASGDPALLPMLRQHNVSIIVADAGGSAWPVLLSLLPFVLVLSFLWFISRGALRNLPGSGVQGVDRLITSTLGSEERPDVSFDDVAGQANAKREVTEMVEYLRDPEPFRALGAQVPRGVLLMGPPGTGKTLLARALAGEANVPFYSISGSAFIEVFVGVGASRVRKLFERARENAPSIVFIDELDSIGRTRGTGLGGGHDEREQTLNQILAEMDGFVSHDAVIVLAATNRPDVLDPALLRPGRFDRHVTLDLPDRVDRRAILDLYVGKVSLDRGVDLEAIAAGTPGFSGAELKNLVNEAAMRAASRHAEVITEQDFQQALDHLMLGAERSLIIQPDERWRLAVHEAGHAVAAWYVPHADPIYKMTIIPRGRALGVTQQLPEAEHYTLDEAYLLGRLTILLAGRAAERTVLDDTSSGAEDDIKQATALARAMVTRWGMVQAIGPVDLRQQDEHPFLGLEITKAREHSEHSASLVDAAVKRLLDDADQRARSLMTEHYRALERLARAVLERESLDAGEIEQVLVEPPPNVALLPVRSGGEE